MMATEKSRSKPEAVEAAPPLPFEAGLARLDEIIKALEKDGVPLDELMKLYEEGVGLLRTCHAQLDEAQQKVKLLNISPDGKTARLASFDTEVEE